ncbi:hypothetical protein ETAA8_09570 [Anatilimnocola aggregata]|uniref:SF3 helicase domain-containing protein n=1 Tax=Anatilimnocola aggregata TaxID=2528021 RepID=A0A517Y6N7_9BACT|nr:phage/plasmid primase, P4 family [Anatilimnocola aggregata]QDU25885.1 hypothetical protein ETAA8_09570 [Anatilimnocola aggregata]
MTAPRSPATASTQVADGKGLMPHHERELMEGSGLSAETIKAAGIYSEWTPAKLGRILKLDERWVKKLVPAIVFPFARADGSNGYSRVKPDNPRVDRNEKKIKYESPRGEPNQVYLPPGVADYLQDVRQELLFTEGEKKSAKATQEGFPCLGLVGVYGWKHAKQECLLPELAEIAWHGRKVFIAFDSDLEEKEGVQNAESRLAAALAAQGAIVRCLRIPHGIEGAKQGLDDLLVAAGDDGKRRLRQLIDDAIEPLPVAPDSEKLTASKLDPAIVAKQFLETGEQDGVYRVRFHRGGFVLWTAGRYVEIPPCEVRARLVNQINQDFNHLSTGITNNVLDQVKAQAILPVSYSPPCWLEQPNGCEAWEPRDLLATKNAIVHLPSFATVLNNPNEPILYSIPATPLFFSPAAIDFEFDPNAPSPEHWLQFMAQLWEDDQESVDMLQEWFGLCLTPDTSFQKILLILGPKRSGKGTLARVLRSVVGEYNCCGPTMSGLGTNFGLQSLLHKTVAIISDARLSGRTDSAVVTERLLSISGEDGIDVDRKHLPPVNSTKLLTRLMILTNELPRLGDSSGALAGRLIILRMTKSFYGAEDRKLTEKLLEERAGIMLWAIRGWRRLRERGYLLQPAAGDQMREQMEDLTSPVGHFVRERCELSPLVEEPTKSLYAAYVAWMLANNSKAVNDATFARDLYAACPAVRPVRRREGDKRWHTYVGVRLLSLEGF